MFPASDSPSSSPPPPDFRPPSSPPPAVPAVLRTLAVRMLLVRSAAANVMAARGLFGANRWSQSQENADNFSESPLGVRSPSSPPVDTATPPGHLADQGSGRSDEDDSDSVCSSGGSDSEMSSTASSATAPAAAATTAVVQGAKRRKPLKTNKVTKEQQHEANLTEDTECPGSPDASSSLREDDCEPLHVSLSDDNEPGSPAEHAAADGASASLEPIVPPGPIPKPVISSTTVVTSDANSIYRCPLCQEDQHSQREFTTHIRGHNEVKPHPDPNDPTGQAKVYYCCLCGKMLSSFSSLDRHMLVHSGERPFSCELCGQTFTTNGNMHRHKRTHSAKELQEYGEAMGVSLLPSGRRGGRKRKNAPSGGGKESKSSADSKIDDPNETRPLEQQMEDAGSNAFRCPQCGETFLEENLLESHLESNHDQEEFKCDECSFSFMGYKLLRMHKIFHNAAAAAAAVVPILAGAPPVPLSSAVMPISSLPTPLIARPDRSPLPPPPPLRAAPNLASPAAFPSLPFAPPSIGKPSSAFPGPGQATTAPPNNPVSQQHELIDISEGSPNETPELESKLPPPSEKTSALNDHSSEPLSDKENGEEKKDASDVEDADGKEDKMDKDSEDKNDDSLPAMDLIGSHGDDDPVIRDMKLKGEFPCRLCPAVYPNLRALKGHNKEHLDKAPYCCNVGNCTYSSNDKSTLTRHMRIHTGEKPYECKLCNYGFTTKANCERHLKNKHGKTNRDQIRENLIIHESEETNGSTSEVPSIIQKLQLEAQREAGNFRCKVCKQLFMSSEKVIAHALKEHPAYSSDVDHIFEELKGRTGGGRKSLGDSSAPSMVPRVSSYPSRPVSSPDQRISSKEGPSQRTSDKSPESDAPLDLSRSVKTNESPPSPPALVVGNPLQNAALASGSIPLASAGTAAAVPLLTNLDPAVVREELIKSNAAMTMSLFPSTAPPLILPQAALNPAVGGGSVLGAGAAFRPPNPTAATTQAALAAALQVSSLNPATAAALMPAAAAALNIFPGFSDLTPEMKQRLQQQQQQQLAAALASTTLFNQQNPVAATIAQLQQQLPFSGAAETSAAGVASSAAHPVRVNEIAAYITSQQELLRKQQQGERSSMEAAAETLQSLSQAQPVVVESPLSLQSNKSGSSQESKGEGGGGSGGVSGINFANGKSDAVTTGAAAASATNEKGNNSDSDSNYKMVIQNGVLMRKQKQRRYRTERPYGCEHCSARFTLRSNMERHIKQQHPQYWASKPRGSRRNHAATVPVLAPQFRCGGGDGDGGSSTQDGGGSVDADGGNADLDAGKDAADISAKKSEEENSQDLVSVSKLLDSATNQNFQHLFENEEDGEGRESRSGNGEEEIQVGSDEEGSGSTEKKKSAYSAAPHKISCPYCSRKFPWTSSLKRHILTHTGDKPYKCSFCPLFFTTKSNCDRHQVRKHGASLGCGSNGGSVGGQDTSFSSGSIGEFGENDEDEYSEGEEEEEENSYDEKEKKCLGPDELPFRCHLCQDAFRDQSDAIGHLQISHAEEYEEYVSRGAFSDSREAARNNASKAEREAEEEREDEREEDTVKATKVTCLFCLGRFWSPEKLRKHVRKHTGERPYTCDICHKRFTQRHSMLRHRKKHDSGVSSDGGSESEAELQISCKEEEEVNEPVERENKAEEEKSLPNGGTKLSITLDQPKTGKKPSVSTQPPSKSGKKRASLMDTIAMLSSAKKKKVDP